MTLIIQNFKNNFTEIALGYHKLDFIPIPIRTPGLKPDRKNSKEFIKEYEIKTGKTVILGKEPIIPGWQKLNLKNYSEKEIISNFEKQKVCNIGLVMGIDNIHGIDFDEESIYQQFSHDHQDIIKNTPVVKTGKGVHVYVKFTNGGFNGAAYYKGKKLGEMRGKGSQLIAPPSRHINGHIYKWLNSPEDVSILEIDSPDKIGISNKPKNNIKIPTDPEDLLQTACNKIKNAPDGDQNNTLNLYAGKVYKQVYLGNLDKDKADKALFKAAIEGGHPESRAKEAIKSGTKFGKQKAKEYKNSKEPYKIDKYDLTDMGNAYRFRNIYRKQFVYIFEEGKFAVWDGQRWKTDESGKKINLMYRRMLTKMKKEIKEKYKDSNNKEITNKLLSWCVTSQWRNIYLSTLGYLKEMYVKSINEMDANNILINCQNGVLNLNTMELMPHEPEFKMMKIVKANYIPKAKAPKWEKFMEDITLGRDDLKEYLQILLGYCLSGLTSEKSMYFLYGDKGDNGKSTFVNTLYHILNNYVLKTTSDSLMLKKYSNGINNDIARLKGARLVIGSEVATGQRFNEGLIRDLCGDGDPITARFLNKEFFTYIPVFKLILYGNHKPYITANDKAIKKKIKIIPFEFEAQKPDKALTKYLKDEEADGIFNWMVEGWKKYKQQGLKNEPKCVTAETTDFFNYNDTLKQFIDEMCETGEGEKYIITKDQLYSEFKSWSYQSGEFIASKKAFGMLMKQHGFQSNRDRDGDRIWLGINLLDILEEIKKNEKEFKNADDAAKNVIKENKKLKQLW